MGKKKKQAKEESEKLKKKKLRELSDQQDAAESGKKEKKAEKAAKKINKSGKKAENEPKPSVPENKIQDKYSRGILPQPDAETSEKAADVFRAFGDETRLQIMQVLEGRELCNSELLQYVSVVQSTLSHHMRVLTDAGVVKCRRYGKYAYYSLCPDRFADAIEWLRYYQAISSVPVKKDEEKTEIGGEDEQQI